MRKLLLIGLGLAAVSAFALRRLLRSDEMIEWEDAPHPGKLTTVDGVAVHHLDEGHGPAVVLIHGFGGHTFSFRKNVPVLAEHYRVIAVDLKGFGYTERPREGDYSLTAQAQMVVGLMDALGIESAVVVGHSMGGEVAMRIAAGFPERVEKLVLVASVSGDRFPSLPPTPILRPFMAAFGRLSSRFLLQRGFYDRAKLTEELRAGYRGPRRIRGFMDGIYRLFRDWRHDRPIDFEKITQPVMILWARAERLPSWMLDRLRKRLPQAEVRYVEEAGHLVLEEQPEAANRLILRFLVPLEVPEEVPTEPQTDVANSSDGIEVA